MANGVSTSLCRADCCPRLAFTDDGKTGAVTADRDRDDVYVDDTTVSIRFSREQLQVLADELAKHSIVPANLNQYVISPKDNVGSSDYTIEGTASDNTGVDTKEGDQ